MRRAIEVGAHAVEVDARVTKDGDVVIVHDEDLARVAGVPRRVSEMSLEEVRSVTLSSGERIPTLGEVLEEIKGRAVLFLELKEVSAAEPAVLDVVRAGALESTVFISFLEEALNAVRAAQPRAYTGLLYAKPVDAIVKAKQLGCRLILPFHRLASQKAVGFAHRMGLRVVAWTVNEKEAIRQLFERGVDGIATDRPDVALEALRELEG
uniref:Glycerophosphodiester phosphodiesterase n=1 Tax=Thermofilum pendens TaxID=2269 RepID=A0A7J3X7A5_THEPE